MECLFTACLVVLHFCLPLARLDIVVSVNGGILAESGWDASSDTEWTLICCMWRAVYN